MAASFSSRESAVRQIGTRLESEIAKGQSLPHESFEQMLRLPRSEVPFLKDTVLSLCEGRLGGGDDERIRRLQDTGATAIRYLGLHFDADTVSEEFVPRLASMAEAVADAPFDDMSFRDSRYERALAIAQIAPRVKPERLSQALEAGLTVATCKGEYHPNLLLPLANYERAYRNGESVVDERIRVSCRNLCLASIRAVLSTGVEAIAEATPETISRAIDVLPLAHITGGYLLTLLPSVSETDDPTCKQMLDEILDHSEWFLSRHERFPGNYVQKDEVELFDRVRSILSVSVAMLSFNSETYGDVAERMRIAERTGQHRLGTALLKISREVDRDDALTLIKDLVLDQLRIDASIRGKLRRSDRDSIMELGAVAWHLDIGNVPEVRDVFNRISDPRGQFYLTKVLEGAPWG